MGRKKLVPVLVGLLILTVLGLGVGWCALAGNSDAIPSGETALWTAPELRDWGRTVNRGTETWRYNSRLTTILFLGVDSHADQPDVVGSIVNGGRADTIALLVLNPDTRTNTVVMLSRDTLAEVELYTPAGEHMFAAELPICLQYGFGNSAARSCYLMKRLVSNVLLDLPIDFYCSMTLDGIHAAVEELGGITLRLEEDWTDLDPGYTAGSVVTFNAEQAESFLRYRDTTQSGSNNTRMTRHGWFVGQMFRQFSAGGADAMEALLEHMGPYLETDMNGDAIHMLESFKLDEEIRKIPGHTVSEPLRDVYVIDEDGMKDLLLEIFYRRVN